jgi:tetratricopeptide (TPR) repeat protein
LARQNSADSAAQRSPRISAAVRRLRPLTAPLLLLAAAAVCGAQSVPQTHPADAWTAKDAAGHAVTVPAEGRTTILVFLRPDQPQTRATIQDLAAATKDRKDLQLCAVVSGDEAAASAARLAADPFKWTAPIVLDTDYAISGRFAVSAWPTTLIVSKAQTPAAQGLPALGTGVLIAHVAGQSASYAADMAAYLDFAAGKIDRAALDKQLASQTIVADSVEQKAARHVEVAQRLLEKGLKDLARAEIAKALAYQPTDPALQAALVRCQLGVGDAQAAAALLAQIKPAALPPSELNLLRGWAAVESERWDDARKSLTAAVELNPQPAEACYFLGLVYQHSGDTAHAAENFRKAFEHTPLGKAIAN